ncbi:hypothetical protein DC498_09595 [Terrimonas sp.]|uniref:hypothetical protein n=1 Tax=Terrimonas sp. TaxID=1914338 RepID=UPI000D50CF2D|nr:hypothetical protein [Terrimonas sp.]PVD52361.1 hypothetical protein DC498_09595 [Terrimonas sp.]
MYKSREIRWFKDNSDQNILDWFAGQDLSFKNTDARADYYLRLGKDDITVKLREGNIEIKQRIGSPEPGKLRENAEGYFENWVKWSFNADKDDELVKEIIQAGKYEWIETIKTRIGLKLTLDESGKTSLVSIKDHIPFGCQIEYTHLVIGSKTYYTFALEWFGEKELQLPSELSTEILEHSRFDTTDSMGYGEFLKKIQ